MPLLKRTYLLPGETIEGFEQVVPSGQRSGAIASLLRAWLDQRERERLRKEIVAGCQDMREVYLELEKEYHPLEEEVQRAVDGRSKTR